MSECRTQRPPVDEAAVSATVADLVGSPVTAVDRVAGSVENQDFAVRTKAGDFIVKIGDGTALAAEAWACRRVRDLGVPAPEVVATSFDDRAPHPVEAPFVLLRHLDGSPLPLDSRDGRAAAEAGEHLRAVHSVAMEGYGYLRATPRHAARSAPPGPYGSWAEVVAAPLRHLDELVAHEVVGAELATRIRETVERRAPFAAYDGPGVLLHGDLKPGHLFAVDGRLTGIIDWGDVLAGDPLYDLAVLASTGPNVFPSFAAGYGLDPGGDVLATLAVYQVVRWTQVLYEEFRAGGDWFEAYRTRITASLDSLR